MRIVVIGAGGQGAIVADILEAAGTPPTAFVDERLAGTMVLGVRVVASLAEVEHDAVIVAIGDNAMRRRVTEGLPGEHFATAIHPFTSIAPSATIGAGSMISAGAIVCARATIGRGVLLNTKASVDHDCAIGDYVHLSVGVSLGGEVSIGDETLIALGATVGPGRSVGARTTIGAGAVVVRDIGDDVVAFGVPARVRSDRRSAGSTR